MSVETALKEHRQNIAGDKAKVIKMDTKKQMSSNVLKTINQTKKTPKTNLDVIKGILKH